MIIEYIKHFFGKTPEPIPEEEPKDTEIDFGHGYKAKKLVNEKWVLMKGESGCDLKHHGYRWKPGNLYWKDCMGTLKEIELAGKDIMAVDGVFKNK